MSHPSEDVSINSRGAQINWATIFKVVTWLVPFMCAAAFVYLSEVFATHQEVKLAFSDYAPLPARVQSLEEFRGRQEKAQERSDAKFEAVQTSIATLAAQQTATDKKVDRILDALERMNGRK